MNKDHMRIGKYRLLELLSEGRYTDVWLAERIDLKKKVAIKILFPQEVRAGNTRLRAKKLFFNEVVNDLPYEQVWPSNVSTCPQS
jgi:serine/threonine protein kinase